MPLAPRLKCLATPPLSCRPTQQRGGLTLFLHTNEESSPASSARCAHHPPTAMRFARSVRKNRGLFRESPLVLPKISLLSDVSRPLFPPFPPHAADSGAFPPSPTRVRKQFPLFPSSRPHSSESNCQFVSRRPRVGADFRGAFTHSSRRKGRKRQLRNTFARNTSNTTLIFAHSYRSPTKK